MKKIKSFFLKIKAKTTIKTYQKPLLVTIVLLLSINLCVLVISAIVGLLVDPAYFQNSFFKAFAHSLSCMISANTITKLMDLINTNMGVVILSAIVIAIEMIIFSGAIIATLTTALKAFIDKKSQAKGKIELENHFVILNYNSKVPEMILNLIQKKYRNNVIIILSDRSKDYINAEIDSLITSFSRGIKEKNKINLIVKQGTPLLHGDLNDISIDKANHIVIMSNEDMREGEDENITNSDLFSLKTLLTVGSFKISNNCNIVVETDSELTKEKIENLAKTLSNLQDKSIIPASFNKKIGQIIASTIINPDMSRIYSELLSYEGCEFYSYGSDDVDKFFHEHNSAIPIIKYDCLFCLAEDEVDLPLKRSNKLKVNKRILKTKEIDLSYVGTVFMIGNNKKGKFILENLNLAAVGYGSSFKVQTYGKNDITHLIEDIKLTSGEKTVLILSDDSVSADSYDANVFVTLIALQSAFPYRKELSFVTELLDSKNVYSVKDFNIRNAIISNKMMSLLLTQLALNKDSHRFFEGLFTTDTDEGGDIFDIKIKKVSSMVEEGESLEFNSKAELIHTFYYTFNKKYMLIGYIHDGKLIFIPKNQDEQENIVIDREDSFIFIKY